MGAQLWRIRRGELEHCDGGLVGVAFDGNVPVEAFVSRGARRLGAPLRFESGDCKLAANALTRLSTVRDESGAAVGVLDALRLASAEVEYGGISLGLSRAPETEGYDLLPLDDDWIDIRGRAIKLPPRPDGAPWTEGGGSLAFYSFDANSCKDDLKKRLEQVRKSGDAAEKQITLSLTLTLSPTLSLILTLSRCARASRRRRSSCSAASCSRATAATGASSASTLSTPPSSRRHSQASR